MNLLQLLPRDEWQVDLLLFRRSGAFLPQVPEWVHILETPRELEQLFGPLKKTGARLPVRLAGTLAGRALDGDASKGRMMFRWKHFYSKALPQLPGHYDVAVSYLEGESCYYVVDKVSADRKLAWIHTDYLASGLRPEDEAETFGRLDGLVTISDICGQALKKAFPQYAEKVHVLENLTSAATVRSLSRACVPEELHGDRFTVLSVGRLSYEKGFDIAVQAAELVKKAGRNFEWLILGQGQEREKLEQMIRTAGLENTVRLAGLQSNPYVYMAHADLLVQPSRVEGRSIVLDEAKMLGLPILATRYRTAADQISDGEDGVIADMTPEALAQGLMRLMDDEALRRQISRNQLARSYDNTAELEKYERLFRGQ